MAVVQSDVSLRGHGLRGPIILDTYISKPPPVFSSSMCAFFVALCPKEMMFCFILINFNLCSYIPKDTHIYLTQDARN